METIITHYAAAFIGACIGFAICALLTMSRQADRDKGDT